jgi:uncharacterized protein (UPF0276 family)
MSLEPAPPRVGPGTIPAQAGIGLRAPHYFEVLESKPRTGWLEVHSENFFSAGGKHFYFLEQLREHYPFSFHCVGLGLGSIDPLNLTHLSKLKNLTDRYQPALVSDHICWGAAGGIHLNDLLPLPYTEEALQHMVERVAQVQDFLGRQILLENVSSYLEFAVSDIPEWEFVSELAQRSGCGVLLDINNIYVNARNHGISAETYIDHIPQALVQEIHLAGFTVNPLTDDAGNLNGEILIDTHSRPVYDAVWVLYERALQRLGPVPTLIEWDVDIPPLATLLAEAQHAETLLERQRRALVA